MFYEHRRAKIPVCVQPYLEKFLLAFIPLFVAIDPIGLIAIFLGLGGDVDAKKRQVEGTLGLITS
ncbi:MAG: multiple antibiotic resistance protein, partial [Verrucomicrobiota bacterium]